MEKKYIKYSLEEFIEDKQFVAWVLGRSKSGEWEKIMLENAEIGKRIKKAKEIVLLLRDSYEIIDEESVLNLWQNIERFDYLHKQKSRKVKLQRRISWAASIFLVFSVGVLAYLFLSERGANSYFVDSVNVTQSHDARLVLSDGEEIALIGNSSTISLNDNELILDNDSVIDLLQRKPKEDKEIQMNEVIIPYGKNSKLLLDDGTKVWLNAGSRLAFPTKFTGKNREVFLEGEAYFEVAKNKNQSFIVNASEISIRVLGTHFDISAYPGDENVETVLLEGSVVVSAPKLFGLGKNDVLLKPYQKANFDKEESRIEVVDEPNAEQYISWTDGWFQFSKESLRSVFNKLERYYNVEIILPPNFLSTELISGKLDLKESLEEVMVTLKDVAEIEYRVSGNIIYIDKK